MNLVHVCSDDKNTNLPHFKQVPCTCDPEDGRECHKNYMFTPGVFQIILDTLSSAEKSSTGLTKS